MGLGDRSQPTQKRLFGRSTPVGDHPIEHSETPCTSVWIGDPGPFQDYYWIFGEHLKMPPLEVSLSGEEKWRPIHDRAHLTQVGCYWQGRCRLKTRIWISTSDPISDFIVAIVDRLLSASWRPV